MDTVIEAQRKLLEERERVEEALVKEKMFKKPNVRDQINSEHRQAGLVERSVDCARKLVEMYHDTDGLRQEEIAVMGGPDEFAEFYRRLKHLKDHHRKSGSEVQTEEPMIMEFMRLDTERKNPPSELQSRSHDPHLVSHDCHMTRPGPLHGRGELREVPGPPRTARPLLQPQGNGESGLPDVPADVRPSV
jgi:hypothetical protein